MKNNKQSSKKELDNNEKVKVSKELRPPTPRGRDKNKPLPRDYGSHIDRSSDSIEQDWAETEEDF